MFVCLVPKISQVMMKWRRQASHLWIYFVAQRPPKLLKDERFERFSKHRSIVDLQQTLEICTLYEDSANF